MATKREHTDAFESDIIILVVGPQLRKFTAHRGCLMKSSFFAACLDKGFREGEDGLIKLPEDDSIAVGKVLEYLYSSNFEYPAIDMKHRYDGELDEDERPHWASLANCYAAADKYCLEKLQNKIMDFVKDAMKERRVFASAVQELTMAGLRDFPMRRFLLKEIAVECIQMGDDEEPGQKSFGSKMDPEHLRLLCGATYDAEDLFSTYRMVSIEPNPPSSSIQMRLARPQSDQEVLEERGLGKDQHEELILHNQPGFSENGISLL